MTKLASNRSLAATDPLGSAKELAPSSSTMPRRRASRCRHRCRHGSHHRRWSDWMQVPACLGGGELDVRTSYKIIETLAYADGSTGWSFMANAGTLALLGSTCLRTLCRTCSATSGHSRRHVRCAPRRDHA